MKQLNYVLLIHLSDLVIEFFYLPFYEIDELRFLLVLTICFESFRFFHLSFTLLHKMADLFLVLDPSLAKILLHQP